MPRPAQEYALTPDDRAAEVLRKFGADLEPDVTALLSSVAEPSEPILGAIVFLARPGRVRDVREYVALADVSPGQLLAAATVKDERG